MVTRLCTSLLYFMCSCFSGPNILVSRLATREAKPNGQHLINPDEVDEFMKGQAIGNLPGKILSVNQSKRLS